MKKINLLFFAMLFLLNFTYAQEKTTTDKTGETEDVKNKNIDWEEFDESSIVTKSEIKITEIQGLWNAYEGVYKFGDHINSMKLTKPFIIEVKGSKYRRNGTSEFKSFTIENNVLTKKDRTTTEIGIINKITPTELIITWKDKLNYTRYVYRK